MPQGFHIGAMFAGCLVALPLGPAQSAPPDEKPSQATMEAEAAAKLARTESLRWEFRTQGAASTQLKLEEDPVLRWSNPHVGRVYGSVFVWTTNGRPAVVASIFQYFTPNDGTYYVELKSLSRNELEGTRDGKKLWSPRSAEMKWLSLADFDAPRSSKRERLQQMRKMAGEFSAELTDRRESSDGKRVQLRLLPQPIHRDKSPDAELPDGAMFTFVQGTDPEILLLFEADRNAANVNWQYAVARLNTDSLLLQHKSREVWSASEWTFRDQQEDSEYVLFKIDNDVPTSLPRSDSAGR
jgi:hypothetical protein